MSVSEKFRTAFWLSLCLTLSACGGGGGDPSDSGGSTKDGTNEDNNGTDEQEEVAPEGAPTVTVDSSYKQLQLSWNRQEDDQHYVVSENPDGVSGFTEIATLEDETEISWDIAAHHHNWAEAAYIVEACKPDECIPSLEVTTEQAAANAIGYLKASNPGVEDEFGQAVAISDDGKTLAVGAHNEQSASTGIDGDQSDDSVRSAGAVYIFTLSDSGWVQEAYIKASAIDIDDDFGHSVALSGDGNTLAVGAPWEENTGVDNLGDTGAVYVFTRSGGEWSEQAYVRAAEPQTDGHFGNSVSLSNDGNVMVVGAPGRADGSLAEEEEAEQTDTSRGPVAGTVHVLVRADGEWSETASVQASNIEETDLFGYDVVVSGDGSTFAAGAYGESSGATGVNGDQADNSVAEAGAVYVFSQTNGEWTQEAYLKAENAQANAHFGYALAMSDNGDVLAAGAKGEGEGAGAAYVYTRGDSGWAQQAQVTASNAEARDSLGFDVALSGDGNWLAVGARWEDSPGEGVASDTNSNTSPNSGAVYMFANGDNGWAQTNHLKASNAPHQAFFGHSVTLDAGGDTLAVGAIRESGASTGFGGDQADQSTENSGAVYLY